MSGRPGADDVHASFHRRGHAVFHGVCVVVALRDIAGRSAIGNHIALKMPLVAQVLLQQHWLRARWLAVNRVVGAHHRTRAGSNCGTECWKVGVLEIMVRDFHIYSVPRWFRAAMHGEVFWRGQRLQILRIVTL